MKTISNIEIARYGTGMVERSVSESSKSRRRTLQQRLDAARLKEAEAAAKLARKNRDVKKYEALARTRERKLDTRRKIIAGALALEHLQFDSRYGQVFRALVDMYIVRDADRALFNLAPLPDDDMRRGRSQKPY